MDIKRTIKAEVEYSFEDLAKLMRQKLSLSEGIDIQVREVTKTEMIPGYDPHNVDCVQRVVGIKFTWTE